MAKPKDENRKLVIRKLRMWADARDRRNPEGHGKTGTALLREAAELLEAVAADV